MRVFNFEVENVLSIRMEHGKELMEQLTSFIEREKITSALIFGIGAVKWAELGYYNQRTKEYRNFRIDKNLEVSSLTGNVSLKDDKPFAHVHAVFSDDEGNCYGGHLIQAEVFAFEASLIVLKGPPPVRELDDVTGLYLWK